MLEPLQLVVFHTKFPQDLHHTPHVPQDLCESCHVTGHDISTVTGPLGPESILKIPKVDTKYLHRIHLEAKTNLRLFHDLEASPSIESVRQLFSGPQEILPGGQKRSITCMDCHGGPTNRAHNFSANDTSCVRCHTNEHKTKVASDHGCVSCHFNEFLMPAPKGMHEGTEKTP
jgi:hypothetical protein